jgi:hypothetical protein
MRRLANFQARDRRTNRRGSASAREHATDAAARIDRRQAARRRLANAVQARIDNVVRLKNARAEPAANPFRVIATRP